MYDFSGRQVFTHNSDTETYSYVLQPVGSATTYSFANQSSGCSCSQTDATFVADPWAQFANAVSSGPCTAADGRTGTLWVDHQINLVHTPTLEACIAADGSPLYTKGTSVARKVFGTISFKSFSAGRSFPDADLTLCGTNCNARVFI